MLKRAISVGRGLRLEVRTPIPILSTGLFKLAFGVLTYLTVVDEAKRVRFLEVVLENASRQRVMGRLQADSVARG
jgi:hypothetical protein